MSLIAYIDKWINERGSASILRDRIALSEQQHELETSTLKTNLDAAELRAEQAEARAQQLQVERDALAEQLRTMAADRDTERQRHEQALKERDDELARFKAIPRHPDGTVQTRGGGAY